MAYFYATVGNCLLKRDHERNGLVAVGEVSATQGECPVWDDASQSLWWVDAEAGLLHILRPGAPKQRTIRLAQPIGSIVPRAGGGVMLAIGLSFAKLDLVTERLEVVASLPNAVGEDRFNDGKCDAAGRFWAGTLTHDWSKHRGAGALYCLEADLNCRRVLSGVTCSNGLVWSLDQQIMYYVDSQTREVAAFDYDLKTGSICNRRAVLRFGVKDGLPDGMTMDEEGMLWVAMFQGGRVVRCDPRTGRLLGRLRLPAPLVTSCTFGGPDWDELYITTARIGMSADQLKKYPLAGAVFRARPGVHGRKAYTFPG